MNSRSNGEVDEDCQFLEQVLDKLYDFGKKKSQKKKKRKRCEEGEEEEEEFPTVKDGCSDPDNREEAMQPQTQQTGPSVRQVEVVVFQDPRKKLKAKPPPPTEPLPAPQITEKKPSVEPEELSLEKARLEVHRFGITGYKKEQQRVFEQDRAVMLGARPPKKDYLNYKQLQDQIKERKQKAKEEVQPELKKKKKQADQSRNKKKSGASSGSGGAPTGQVGHFKNGMLILSSKEIQKIKGNKRRK